MPHGLRNLSVLVVDDFPDTVDLLAEILGDNGYSVNVAFDGTDAIDRALQAQPDLILMDLAMPNLDGLAATRRLKGDPRTHDIPVVLYTGHPGADVAQRAHEAGCRSVITKPALEQVLLDAVDDALRSGLS